MRAWLLLACACAATPADAPIAPGPPPVVGACYVGIVASCYGSSALAEIASMGEMNHSCTDPWGSDRPSLSGAATCTTGCALEVESDRGLYDQLSTSLPASDLYALVTRPEALCAETPDAQPGDACSSYALAPNSQPCVPTRAQLGSDGTVTGQAYLACAPTGTCVTAPAPTIAGYLTACAGSGATAGSAGVDVFGSDHACLVAPGSDGTVASGLTIRCVGDWECPQGSLCDDQIAVRATTEPLQSTTAVCKPGPRSVLTASMLAE